MGAQEKQEKAVENREEKKDEQNIEVGKPQPSCVLLVDLHCSGCAKKIVRSFSNLQGVEHVEVDMVNNKVTVKGSVDPLVVCSRITQKTKRSAEVLSPLPRPQPEPTPPALEVVASQTKVRAVEINVHMHCEPCAAQLHRKIRRMPGVESVVMDIRSGKMSVTGTVEAQQLVEYIYKRTGKHAKIVVPEMEVEKEEAKGVEEKKISSVSKEDEAEKTPSPPPQTKDEQKKEATIEESIPIEAPAVVTEKTKRTVETANGEYAESLTRIIQLDHPLYPTDPMPHPHLFSDENPNACCIS